MLIPPDVFFIFSKFSFVRDFQGNLYFLNGFLYTTFLENGQRYDIETYGHERPSHVDVPNVLNFLSFLLPVANGSEFKKSNFSTFLFFNIFLLNLQGLQSVFKDIYICFHFFHACVYCKDMTDPKFVLLSGVRIPLGAFPKFFLCFCLFLVANYFSHFYNRCGRFCRFLKAILGDILSNTLNNHDLC